MTTLKLGDLGVDVLVLRLRLGVGPWFYFDERTQKAVKAFQKDNKLKVDGEVGPLTRKALGLDPVAKPAVMHPLKPWLDIAISQKDVEEYSGWWWWADNKRIVEYSQTTNPKVTTDEVPWCGSFVNWVMIQSGRTGKGSAAAKDWLKWGDTVTTPQRGDIVIIRNKSKKAPDGHHVGFYISLSTTHIKILGGNQGTPGKVSEEDFSLQGFEVLGYRRPKTANVAIYLKFGTMEGNVTAAGYEGCIALLTASLGAARNVSMEPGNLSNREPSKPSLSQIAITKLTDKATLALVEASLNGSGGDATISFVRTGNILKEFMTYKLKDCRVTHCTLAAHADETSFEGYLLSYSEIEIACAGYDASGKVSGPQRIAYDVGAAKAA